MITQFTVGSTHRPKFILSHWFATFKTATNTHVDILSVSDDYGLVAIWKIKYKS